MVYEVSVKVMYMCEWLFLFKFVVFVEDVKVFFEFICRLMWWFDFNDV